MPTRRQQLGKWGEDIAARRLVELGYDIVARNWRCAAGELDIIARHRGELVFVEVKTRWGGPPEESIGPAKQIKLVELARKYLQLKGVEEQPWRIDAVLVELDGDGHLVRLEVIESAVGE
ncbi:MAG: YraN family protein [Anaerolineae bacterium]|nr:YraN family protein [Anaerolineae bacterium]